MTSRYRWHVRALMLGMLYFTFIGGTFLTDQRLWPRIIHHALVTVGLLIWLVPSLWGKRSLPSTPLDLPLAALFLSSMFATVFAVDPRVSIEFLWVAGVHTLFFYAAVAIMRAWKPRVVLEPLFFAASVVVLIGLYEFAAWYFGLGLLPGHDLNWLDIGGLRNPIPPQIYRLALTLGVSTNLSGYLALLIPVAVSWAAATQNVQTRRMVILWLVPACVVEILTFSRGGLLSLAISLPLIGAAAVISSAEWRNKLRRIIADRRVQTALVIPVVMLGVVVMAWSAQDRSGHQAGDTLRFDLWRSAWRIGLSDPLTGVGPGGFGRAVRAVRNPSIAEDRYTSPHDIPLLIWAEAGLPGLVAFGWLLVAGLSTVFRRWRDAVSAGDKMRVLGAAAALIGFGVQNIFDNLIMTPNLLPVLILTAYLSYPYSSVVRPRPVIWVTRVIFAVIILSGVGWFLSDRAQRYFDQSVRYIRQDNQEAALASIDTARRLDPQMGYYLAQRAQILADMSLEDPDRLPQALAAYNTMLAVEASYDVIHANYAQLLNLSGDQSSAREHLQTAYDLYPRQARYILWQGMLAEQDGDLDDAEAGYSQALDSERHWLTSPFWQETEFRQQVQAGWLDEHGLSDVALEDLAKVSSQCWPTLAGDSAVEDDPLCRAEITHHVYGDLQAALAWYNRAVDELPPETVASAYRRRSEVYYDLAFYDAAEQDALTALFLGDRWANAVLGALAEDQGDMEEAISYYLAGGPIVVQYVGWDVAVYARRGHVILLNVLDAPGPSRYDFAAWLALVDLYEREGQADKAAIIRAQIRVIDPYFQFSAGQ